MLEEQQRRDAEGETGMKGWEERGGGSVSQVSHPRATPRPSELFPVGFHGNTHTFPSWLHLRLTPQGLVLSGAWVLHEGSPKGRMVRQASPDPCLLQKPPSVLIPDPFLDPSSPWSSMPQHPSGLSFSPRFLASCSVLHFSFPSDKALL